MSIEHGIGLVEEDEVMAPWAALTTASIPEYMLSESLFIYSTVHMLPYQVCQMSKQMQENAHEIRRSKTC